MDLQLAPGTSDQFVWRWLVTGTYSSRSAYRALLLGQVAVLGANQLWKVKAPNEYCFFMWLVHHGRFWTSECLQRYGLRNNGPCALCQQQAETLDHLIVACVFSRETWFKILWRCGWQHLTPTPTDLAVSWWIDARKRVSKPHRQAFDSLVLLVVRQIWLEHNSWAFWGQFAAGSPSLAYLGGG
jgi:hypothetical protein